MLSCCVAPDELAKVYALLSAFDNLLPLGITEGYSLIFEVRMQYLKNKTVTTVTAIKAARNCLSLEKTNTFSCQNLSIITFTY